MTTTFEKTYASYADKDDFWNSVIKNDPLMKEFIVDVLADHVPIPNRNLNNQVMKTDSYKSTQHNMWNDFDFDEDGLKETLLEVYSSVEARVRAKGSHVIVAGVQAIALELESIRVSMDDIKDAIVFYAAHFGGTLHSRFYFNPLPWVKIVLAHDGRLPLEFKAIPEGTIVPVGVPLCTIRNTDRHCAQLVSHVEGWLLKAMWYPVTVATTAFGYSKIIKNALMQTADVEVVNACLPFSLHDFAYRGTTSEDAAQIGCGAALYVTMGSDTVRAVEHVMRTMCSGYTKMAGFSVAASEHNQAMCKGRTGEFKQLKRVLKNFPNGALSYVADTFNLLDFVRNVSSSGEIRDLIMARDGVFVIRPDSCLLDEYGHELSPAQTISVIFDILDKNLHDVNTVNSKGYKVLDSHFKVIYGDGLNERKIEDILNRMIKDGWCTSNIIFGVGGNLAQCINRDTYRFAMKASEQTFLVTDQSGKSWTEVRQVSKETQGKESKKGRFHIVDMGEGNIKCFSEGDQSISHLSNMLETYTKDGSLVKTLDDLDTVRNRVHKYRNFLNM